MNLETKRFASLLSFALMLGACGPTEEQASVTQEPSTQSESSIINGTNDSADPAVVAIFAKIKGQDKGGLCTGTIIAPNVVLTAAHCVDPAAFQGYEIESFTVITDWNMTDGVADADKLKVRETHFDPAFDINNVMNGHDIAVVILAENTRIQPLPWNSKALENYNKKPIRMVGYGLSDGFNQTGAGLKRQAKSKTTTVNNLFVKHGQFFIGPRICNGDSGGPILATIDGKETVIGVNSFGFIYCLGESNSTRVDTYADFVRKYLPQ